MDNIEIILKNIEINKFEYLTYLTKNIDIKDIISSHLYDSKNNRDIEYSSAIQLQEYVKHEGTCSIFLKSYKFGINLKSVLLLIVSDGRNVDVTIDFNDSQFMEDSINELKSKILKLLYFLENIYKGGTVEKIIIGYEPAEDDDMKIACIIQDEIKKYNENISQSKFATAFYKVIDDK